MYYNILLHSFKTDQKRRLSLRWQTVCWDGRSAIKPEKETNETLYFDFLHRSHTLTNFHYWCWKTITGSSGVILTLVCIVLFTFATQYARRRAFKYFWLTHKLYILVYMLMIFHGLGGLLQPPFMWFFFLGPAILFTLDKLVSVVRNKTEITVVQAELLPSGKCVDNLSK